MAEAENVALYRRLIDECVATGDVSLLDELLEPSIDLPTLLPMAEPTVAGLKNVLGGVREAFPDARAEIVQVIASGDWVAATIAWTGTHTGEFAGISPTGRRFDISEIELVRCASGRISELRNVFDIASLIAQLS